MKKSFLIFIGIVGLATLGVVGWFVYGKSESNKPLTSIVVRLKWLHQSQFSGHYVADQKGYYKDEGLSATFIPFDYKTFPIDEVVSGRAGFGVTGADELLIAREQGKKVKALAVIYQENPVVAYALASSGIAKPIDLIGKKIGIEKSVNVETIIHAMLVAQGIDYKNKITEVPINFDVAPVLKHEVDVGTGYVTNEPIQVEESGQKVNVIAPYQYGVKMYSDVLFTSEDMIANHPDMVRGFVRATLKGWDYALAHIDEAANLTLLYKDPNNTALNFAHQKALLTKSLAFIKPKVGSVVGEMNYADWKRTAQLLVDYQVLKKDSDVSSAYTTAFLR